ncbi:MAG: phosphate ABC transporter substrate-binding protein [Thermosynechococcaceae cyanobacterium]
MAQRSGPPPIVFILIFLALLGGGYWFLFRKPAEAPVGNAPNPPTNPVNGSAPPVAPSTSFQPPASVPSGTAVRIDGSTSMVQINETLKKGFQQKFPGTTVATNAGGSDKGLQDLQAGAVDVAAISRPLTAQEQGQGLMPVEVAKDAIAIVVGNANPFRTGLTSAQVMGIFQGQIQDWSAVGKTAGPIKVINRPAISGTHKAFQSMVLKGGDFGTGSNFTTLERDATTPLLQALNGDGIGYATYAQVANQQTIRTVAVDGLTPEAPSYPFTRSLYYVYKNPASPGVQAFLGYASSPEAQQLLAEYK